MTIHTLAPVPQQPADPSADSSSSTAYDSVWAGEEAAAGASPQMPPPSAEEEQGALERTMLAQDKLYVVLAVVVLIWLGVAALLVRTDRRLANLERRFDDTK
ncbi:MAG: hypothetical protein BRD46_03510 [Bacteroidetes bacterium QS_8_68_15]|jgi:hypothetical protein|nr:MAG: hypothetical protein BRD46_03510 [Bacteroidetes bacterium QS_8_68_15]